MFGEGRRHDAAFPLYFGSYLTVTFRVELLLAEFASGVEDETVAVWLMVPLFPRMWKFSWYVFDPPAGIVPRLQVKTTPEGSGQPASLET